MSHVGCLIQSSPVTHLSIANQFGQLDLMNLLHQRLVAVVLAGWHDGGVVGEQKPSPRNNTGRLNIIDLKRP